MRMGIGCVMLLYIPVKMFEFVVVLCNCVCGMKWVCVYVSVQFVVGLTLYHVRLVGHIPHVFPLHA